MQNFSIILARDFFFFFFYRIFQENNKCPQKTPLGKFDHVAYVPTNIVAQGGKKLPVLFTTKSPIPRTGLAQRRHSINGDTE